ncbi:Eukaryotic translation initiation factor 3 subunit L [Entophlyctis luteolus]|nr:Eukaryotic translation initiation factor 3 subunit L [Entophlyctis luteolus]
MAPPDSSINSHTRAGLSVASPGAPPGADVEVDLNSAEDADAEDLADVVAEEVDLAPVIVSFLEHDIAAGPAPAVGQQQLHNKQQKGPSAKASGFPDQLVSFVRNLYSHINAPNTLPNNNNNSNNQQQQQQNLYDLLHLYEVSFHKVSDRFYSKTAWPTFDAISTLLPSTEPPSPLFVCLYNDLFYRHIFARSSPTLQHWESSFDNYLALFSLLLDGDGPLELELPNQWLWDIVDEFVSQFQAFWLAAFSADELAQLSAKKPKLWHIETVFDMLDALMDASQIRAQLTTPSTAAPSFGSYASKPLYRMLGYFALISRARVHVLTGDYSAALETLAVTDLSRKGLFARVTACHVTTFYTYAFACAMSRRYGDAVHALTHILLFVSRTKQFQAVANAEPGTTNSANARVEAIMKRADQMYALLAMCLIVCPMRVDENVHVVLREKYGEHMQRMAAVGNIGGEVDNDSARVQDSPFVELFRAASPRFIAPQTHNLTHAREVADQQTHVFVAEVGGHAAVSAAVRSYLKLYTTISVHKLAGLMDVSPATAEDDARIRAGLLLYKHKMRARNLAEGRTAAAAASTGELFDFYVRGDMVHVSESRVERRIGEWFVRQIGKFEDTIGALQRGA